MINTICSEFHEYSKNELYFIIGVNPAAALGGTSGVIKWDLGQEGGTGSHFFVSGV